MKLLSKKFLLLLCVVFSFSACYYDNFEEMHPVVTDATCDTTGTISYANDIVPILSTYCGISPGNTCHSTDGSSSGIVLDDYSDVSGNGSLMVRSINHDGSLNQVDWMPSGGGMINKCSINKIEAWVNRGRLNN